MMYSVSILNRSLKAITDCNDGIQELDDIKTVVNYIISSLSIVQCECKHGVAKFGATINNLDDTTYLQHCFHNNNECKDIQGYIPYTFQNNL